MSNEPKKQKNIKSQQKTVQRILAVLLGVFAIVMACLVGYAMRLGMNQPAVSTGEVRAQNVSTEPSTEAPTPEATTTEAPTETESTEESTQPPTSSERLAAQALLDSLTIEEKIGQMIFATPDSLTGVYGADLAGATTKRLLETYPVGGMVYFAQNIRSPGQIRSMVENSQSYCKIPLFIGVDEEGGRVSRLSPVGVTQSVEPMAVYGETGDAAAVQQLGKTLGTQMKEVGFNLNFAPVADVITNENNTEIGDRAFSSDPRIAAEMVAAMTRGLQESGVSACLKHFPGHGSTSADSHEGRSVSQRTLDELRQTELLPFAAGIEADAGMVMISHMSLPAVVGDETPCDLSYAVVTELLRNELGFEGVIITDSHEMASITAYYESGEAALLAVQAGCDVVLMPRSVSEAYDALLKAVYDGTLTEERINQSVLRILELKYELGILSMDT